MKLEKLAVVVAGVIAAFSGSFSKAALVTTVGGFSSTYSGSSREAWVNAGSESLTVEDLNSQTNFASFTNATDAAGSTAPWLPSGFNTTWNLGPNSVTTTLYDISTGYLSLPASTNLTGQGNGYSFTGSTSGKWVWLQFTPNAGPVSAFAADYWTTYNNMRSNVGYFSWRVYFTDGTNELGRITNGTDVIAASYNTAIQAPAGSGFIGFRENTGAARIQKVEFFQYTNGSTVQLDNLTFGVAAVPEPTALGTVALLAVTGGVAMIRRRK